MEVREKKILPGKTILLFILVCLCYCSLLALDPGRPLDGYVLEGWDIEDGLPGSRIYSIAQTPDGYMWISTLKGLARFDGVKFVPIQFKEINPKKKKKILVLDVLFVDKKGTLWIGGLKHLTKYRCQTGEFTTFTGNEGPTGHRVYCMNEDSKGNLWLGFKGCDMERFTNNRFRWFTLSGNPGYHWIMSIIEDKKGNLLVGTYKNGIFTFREGNFLQYKIKGLSGNVHKIYEDRQGILWIGTRNGLARVNNTGTPEVTRVYTTRDGLSNNHILDILEDSDGNLWLAALKGLNRLKKDRTGQVVFDKMLEDHTIFRLFEDKEKNLWFTADEAGLKRLKNPVFTNHVFAGNTCGDIIYSIYQDRRGDTWTGSHNGKLARYRDGQYIECLDIPGRTATGINGVAEDREGNLWLAISGEGVVQKKGKNFIHFTTRDGLADNNVYSITCDSKNNVWIGTDNGVSRYCRGEFQSLNQWDGLIGKSVYNVYEDKDHHTWIATDNGVNVLKNGKLNKENMSEYLKGLAVISIYEEDSEESVLWIATYGAGLKRFKDGKFISYTTAEGMNSDFILQVIEDDRENLWMTSDKGILRVNKNQLNGFAEQRIDRIDCTSFGISDGIKSTLFYNRISRNSVFKTRQGELWFVTKNGIAAVNPGKISAGKLPPPVIIEDVVYNNRAKKICSNNNIFKGIKEVAFHFTSPAFATPGKIKFRYKLEGYDRSWLFLPPGAERVARYTCLGPGAYTFKVTACSGDGVWNNVGDSYPLTSKPFFYETGPFKVSAFLLCLALVSGGYFWYKKRPNGKTTKYKNSHLHPAYVEECIKKLTLLMEIEHVYRDENISLQTLSEKLSISPHHLSRIINENLDKNFPDFINTYRVAEAKKLLIEPKWADRKILSIAFEVGFNTKVAFNNAFKKHTRMTPSQYKNKNNGSGPPAQRHSTLP